VGIKILLDTPHQIKNAITLFVDGRNPFTSLIYKYKNCIGAFRNLDLSSDEFLDKLRRDRLCGLVVRITGYRSRVPDSIPGATRFSEK
jgi:hypothetical protein